ncbi:hypothetical protein [Pedobacter aquatilis]|uniref:hypothetical protein n=1 Tax=Pedobacter aquatilis TaxID=351343 RepID=UPI00292D00FA|nr:hypothetical protein [Pedobacter aquatilis]
MALLKCSETPAPLSLRVLGADKQVFKNRRSTYRNHSSIGAKILALPGRHNWRNIPGWIEPLVFLVPKNGLTGLL